MEPVLAQRGGSFMLEFGIKNCYNNNKEKN